MEFLIGLIVGLVVGLLLGLLVSVLRKRQRQAEREAALQQMRETFSALAVDALDANSKRLVTQNESVLDGKKKLIDQSIQDIKAKLTDLQQAEKQRNIEYGKLSSSVGTLSATTGELHKMLASTQRRGAWGERMAEDVLRLAGLAEGVNYRKQKIIQDDGVTWKPDFTFMLPNDLVVNMDVKFPLKHYKAYIDANDDTTRTENSLLLVRDVRDQMIEVSKRGYVDTKHGTVPYVLVFIPSEQIFSLVMETQPDLLDEALGKQVVLTSPMTLYAMLAVIRQSTEHANLMKTTDEVLAILGAFDKQWQKYNIELDKLGKYVGQAAEQFQKVSATRSTALQRQLNKIEDLRQQRGLPELPENGNETPEA